jgi:flagellin-like protein
VYRPFFHDKRGVSEVVASLIMLLIVSIMGTTLYSYSMSTFSLSWSSYQIQTIDREEQAQERFSIIAIWWDGGNQLNLTILNYGKIEFAIDSVYIHGKAVTAFISGRGKTVTHGNIISVKFNLPIIIQDGQSYEIIAVSKRGSKDVVNWKAQL